MIDFKRAWQMSSTALALLRSIAYDARFLRVIADGHTGEYARAEARKVLTVGDPEDRPREDQD